MKRLTCCLALLLCTFICSPAATAKNLFLNSANFDTLNSEGHAFYDRADFYYPARKVLLEDDAAAMVQLRDMALQGDFKALAALTLITRFHEQQGRKPDAKIPAQFWEDWMYRLLGEQEGGYILGAISQGTASILDSNEASSKFVRMGADPLRRAAKAGHAEAMFGISLLSDDVPDPDFRMPVKPDFHIVPGKIMRETDTPEAIYWISKAAATGSSRSNLVIATNYLEHITRFSRNSAMGIHFLKLAVSLGNGEAARDLRAYLDPRLTKIAALQANCQQAMYYFALHERVLDEDGRLDMEKAGYRPYSRSSGLRSLTERFDHMRDGKGGYAQCLTSKEEFHALLAESRVEYEAIRASLEAKQRDKDVLYNRARARLPEFRAAYEKIMRELEPAVTPGAAPEPPRAPDEKKSEEDSSPQQPVEKRAVEPTRVGDRKFYEQRE